MNKLVAKVLTVTFLPQKLEGCFQEDEYDCEAWRFKNGLIVIPEVHNPYRFYPSEAKINYDNDRVVTVTETKNTKVVTTTELIDFYQQFLTEFDSQLDSQECNKLVDSLTTKPMSTEAVTFYFTARSSVTLDLSKEEIEALQATDPSKLYYEVINKACNENDEQTNNTSPGWEMDDDPAFEIEE